MSDSEAASKTAGSAGTAANTETASTLDAATETAERFFEDYTTALLARDAEAIAHYAWKIAVLTPMGA